MSDHLRPSFQAENFRGNDSSPMRDAACQAYSPDNQAVFRIDIRSAQGTESLPSLQIVFEQDGNNSRNFSGRGESSHSDQFSRNPWHHGHENHSHGHYRMNDSSSSGPRFLGNDRTFDFGPSSPFDRRSGKDNSFVSINSPPWESQSDFSRGYGSSDRGRYRDGSRYASPLELLNQLAEYFRQNDLSNSLDGNGFTSGPGSQFRLVDSTYRLPTQLPALDAFKPPSPNDLLSGLPTPPGLPKPGDLLSHLPTPPGLPSPKNIFDKLPNPFKLFG
jgi:hypothetical protein